MSEFIAEAQVLVLPNTATFAASLKAQVEAAVAKSGPVLIPIAAAPVAGAASSTAALVAAQESATAATLGLSAATGLETEALDLAARAQVNAAVAAEAAGVAASQEAAQVALLVTAENAAAVAFTKTEAVALASVGATTELAAARATLRAATIAVTANEAAFDAALLTTSAAHKNNAAEALVEARALQVNAAAAFDSAEAHRVNAVATAHGAASHAQATRGLAAETLALGGLRGATLAASAPFLIGATAAIVFAKSIKAASDETEQLNKVAVVFGESSQQIEDFSKKTAESLGISADQALEAAGIFGNLFRTIKISEPVAADMSQRLVQLAADLASFNNASPERTLEALRAGLVGQARPLRVFGIFLSAARVQQQALIDTGKDSVTQLTEAEKVQARFNLILRDSNIAQGDFARTSGRLANQSRILKAQLADLSVEIGRQLVPGLSNAVSSASNVIRIFGDLKDITGEAVNSNKQLAESADSGRLSGFRKELAGLLTPGRELKIVTKGLADGLDFLAGKTDAVTQKMSGFHFALGGLPAELAAIQAAAASVDFGNILQQLNALEVGRLKIQTGLTPGGRSGEEANLRKQIEDDKKAVAQSASGTAERRKRLQELKSDQDDLARLQEQDASDAESRAQRIKDAAARQQQAAEDAARAQSSATQAFIESFSGRRGRIQQRLASAQLFGTAKTQIALNKLIVAADKAEIEAIKDRIRHLKLHGEALKIAKAAIEALNQEIFNTRNAILQLQASRKQALADARQSHLEAQLAIAETTASTKDDRAAEKALIAFDQAQIRRLLALKRRRRLTQDEAAQLDAYRVDLAQRNAELKKTQQEQQNGANIQQAFFKFLQTQQGFAANLLGNLIPGFATAGLVGGSAQAAGDTGLRQVAGGFEQPRGAVASQAALASGRERGVRPVQVDTTNHLLRQILRSLQNLNGRASHPEARYQNRVAGSNMDTIGGV